MEQYYCCRGAKICLLAGNAIMIGTVTSLNRVSI